MLFSPSGEKNSTGPQEAALCDAYLGVAALMLALEKGRGGRLRGRQSVCVRSRGSHCGEINSLLSVVASVEEGEPRNRSVRKRSQVHESC